MKLKKFYLIFLFLVLSCANQQGIKTLKYYYAQNDINLTSNQLQRLNNYLVGEFFSSEMGRNVFAYPMAFIISEDGSKSIILACAGVTNECNPSFHIYQLLKKYKKKTNTEYKILFLNRKNVTNNFSLNDINFKEFKRIKFDNQIFFDRVLLPQDSCGSDDC